MTPEIPPALAGVNFGRIGRKQGWVVSAGSELDNADQDIANSKDIE